MIWIMVFVLGVLVELFTTTFVALCFSVGSVFGFLTLLLHAPLVVQILSFLIATGLAIWLLKPLRDRYLSKDIVKTNVDALIGEWGIVMEPISNLDFRGAVKVKGITYSARSENGEEIPTGTQVIVNRVEGVKFYVSPL
ncbi:NfeD family protein (plasmid) [Paenibacillus polymyxa]|nr:NfeD family protein [Paenibacillus polymyxa]WPQ59505.1 NfeD family protein [Paenibacillus polymyxa]